MEIDRAELWYYQALAFQQNVAEETLMSRALFTMSPSLRYMGSPKDGDTRTR